MEQENVLQLFTPATQAWFREKIGTPTLTQREGWPAIASGDCTLISAPTGTGKTLAAFLLCIDRLKALAAKGELEEKLYLIYISPLKALGNDIRENLKRPNEGIPGATLRVSVRTGDTTSYERQKMLTRPPHILITTPESLYLLLTTQRGRGLLKSARTIILDELHAMINTKRGTHLMLSLARLDELCGEPLQRIGLSATITPLEKAGAYLAYPRTARLVAPKMDKSAAIEVTGVLPDLRALPEGSIWPELANAVYDRCRDARTVIAFVEGRQQAEKLAYLVNQLAGEGFARTHHGCVSKEQRLQAEQLLRSGQLRLLCATSSMELGIDVGDVDLVLQIGCPRTVSGTLQRLGRAGHNPGRTSVMTIYPKTAADGVYCGLVAQTALTGGIEPCKPLENCLDVAAQHLVSMASDSAYTVDEAVALFHSCYCYKAITKEQIQALLRMLAGDYEHLQDRPTRPRLLYDRIHEQVQGDLYSRMLALNAGGTIPDRGWYPVVLPDGTHLGELDEEYVYEARVGDKFMLGAFAWRIHSIQKDRVVVNETDTNGANPPFWKGDMQGRGYVTGKRFGALMRRLDEEAEQDRLTQALLALHLDQNAADNAARVLENQRRLTGCLPSDKLLIFEHFADDAGDHQLMVHSVFGRQINYPLSLLLQRVAQELTGLDVRTFEDDDGLLLYLLGSREIPDGLIFRLDPASIERVLCKMLPATPLFSMNFRCNAARALMMGLRSGSRQPLWVQRLRSAETLTNIGATEGHPLLDETLRECAEEYMDIPALIELVTDVLAGRVAVREVHTDFPSPMAMPMRRAAEMVLTYEYATIPGNVNRAVEAAMKAEQGVAPMPELLQAQSKRRREPENAEQLHTLLLTEGDVCAGETQAPVEWMESLIHAGRARFIEPGLWIATEEETLYQDALTAGDVPSLKRVLRRCLRYRGSMPVDALAERYCLPEADCQHALDALVAEGAVVFADQLYHHGESYARAQQATLTQMRHSVKTMPAYGYAALLAGRLHLPGTPLEQLEHAVSQLTYIPYPLTQWESTLLPARCPAYKAALLDQLLSGGSVFWRIGGEPEKPELSFYPAGAEDWDAEPLLKTESLVLTEQERIIGEALCKRGASFAHALSPLLGGASPLDALLSLAMKGLIRADSLAPLRFFLQLKQSARMQAKQLARVRAQVMSAGRWEPVRPLKPLSAEQKAELVLERYTLLSKETAPAALPGFTLAEAIEPLRLWEYTGRLARGYYVHGMSGMQFVRAEERARLQLALDAPEPGVLWLPAQDPMQPYGLILPHESEQTRFMRVPGTLVALNAGKVCAVLEGKGESLRVLDIDAAPELISALARAFLQKRVLPELTHFTLKQFDRDLVPLLEGAGFRREMLDYSLWRA